MVAYDTLAPATPPIDALLIEDDPDDRGFIERGIRMCGMSVELHSVDRVGQALRHLDEVGRVPHLMFVDLRLPDFPGDELLHWLRRRAEFSDVWLIAVTGRVELAAHPPAKYGADALLAKPIAAQDLATVLALVSAVRARRTRAAEPS